MPQKQFQRTIEDFTCGHCGAQVRGNGYTNHCPHCLWSKHVDQNPGDRAASCRGLMEPIEIEQDHGDYYILQRCQKCGHERRNKKTPEDDMFALIKLSQKL